MQVLGPGGLEQLALRTDAWATCGANLMARCGAQILRDWTPPPPGTVVISVPAEFSRRWGCRCSGLAGWSSWPVQALFEQSAREA